MIDTAISLSTRGHFRILKSGHFNFLLTEEVRWPGGVGAAAPEATGRGEPAIETHGCGFESGQADVAGCSRKKVLKPVQKRRQLSALQAAYRVSTRRACEVIGLPRATYYYQAHRPTDSALRHRLIKK